jgi:hypothetical protein
MHLSPATRFCRLLSAFLILGVLISQANGQELSLGTVKLKNKSVAYGEVDGDDRLINKGYFTQVDKPYMIKGRKGNFIKISDGITAGWVFKSSVIEGDSETQKPDPAKTAIASGPKQDTPQDVIRKAKEVGLHQEMRWHKSEFDGKWVSQSRAYNGPAGRKLSADAILARADALRHNELNCEVLGARSTKVDEIRIEAELNSQQHSTDTLNLGVDLLKKLEPKCPDSIINAFRNRQESQSGNWTVRRSNNQDGSVDITAEYSR